MSRKILLSFLLVCLLATSAAQGGLFDRFRNRGNGGGNGGAEAQDGPDILNVAGLNVAYWLPSEDSYPAPLVIFSHGFKGCKTQSKFLMKALAAKGYIVVAPDHKDASCGNILRGSNKPEESFRDYASWNDSTYKDRATDIKKLYEGLKALNPWGARIDWTRVALAGHSLGGYTALGLAGAWPSWKMKGIRAVLALSPYAAPFVASGDLAHLGVPVMYQTGARDMGIRPSLVKEGGAFEKTASPAALVDFKKTGHFGWTDLQSDRHDAIIRYSLWFLDSTLKGSDAPLQRVEGEAEVKMK